MKDVTEGMTALLNDLNELKQSAVALREAVQKVTQTVSDYHKVHIESMRKREAIDRDRWGQ